MPYIDSMGKYLHSLKTNLSPVVSRVKMANSQSQAG